MILKLSVIDCIVVVFLFCLNISLSILIIIIYRQALMILFNRRWLIVFKDFHVICIKLVPFSCRGIHIIALEIFFVFLRLLIVLR